MTGKKRTLMAKTYTLEEITETLYKFKAILKLLNDRCDSQQAQIKILNNLRKLHEGEHHARSRTTNSNRSHLDT